MLISHARYRLESIANVVQPPNASQAERLRLISRLADPRIRRRPQGYETAVCMQGACVPPPALRRNRPEGWRRHFVHKITRFPAHVRVEFERYFGLRKGNHV